MTQTEVLRLALEALENWLEFDPENFGEVDKKTITAIKAALEAKDEPVAWKWHQAPVKTSWGHEMVVADLAIDKDHTASIYCERDQTAKVKAMFTTPQRTPITDEDIRQANHHMVCGAYDYSFKQGVRWAEKVHGIKWEWEA
jgi:aerobic-type carbon monoxide dehydrogenase small subunit (CoxS/CutS family)